MFLRMDSLAMQALVEKLAPLARFAAFSLISWEVAASSEVALSTDLQRGQSAAVVIVDAAAGSPADQATSISFVSDEPAPFVARGQASAPAVRGGNSALSKPGRRRAAPPTRAASDVQPASFLAPAEGGGEQAAAGGASKLQEELIDAHRLSLSARTEAEFSQIIRIGIDASTRLSDADAAQFARDLAAWALNRRGQIRAEEGQDALALADFEAALAQQPNQWRALHNRGVTYAQCGDFANAFDDFSHVIRLKPDFAKAYANRATLYAQAGEAELALKDYAQALAHAPQLTAAHLGRGRVCHALGRLDEALAHFDQAAQQRPDDAETLCSRADLLADLGRYEEALGSYAQAIQQNPELAHAYRNGAWLLATCPDARFRDPENAIRGAEQALKFGYGQRYVALDTLAAALASAGRFEEAMAALQQALDIAPEQVRGAYLARMELYEMRQPFTSHPVEGVRTAVYAE
jgi:tetratricopeptide (TPR) repeat protein